MDSKKIFALLLTITTVLVGIVFGLTLLLRITNQQPVENIQNIGSEPASILKLAGSEPNTLDPHLMGDATSAQYASEIYGGLVTITPALEINLDLAESLDISEDGLVYRFKLRENIFFHSGRKVTADDIKWSFERAASPELNSNTSLSYLADIIGFKEKRFGLASSISGITVIDKSTIEIVIDSPKAYFLAKLSYPTAFVLDYQQIEANPRNWTRKPNGTGPYKIKEWRLSEKIILESNNSYHLGVPNIQIVEYQLSGGSVLTRFENGEVDVAYISTSDIDRVRDPNEKLNKLYKQSTSFSTYYIGLNVNQAPFDDVNVRKAFASAIDIKKVTDLTFKGMVPQATGILPPGMFGYDSSIKTYSYNPEKAREYLARSKYGSAENLPTIVLSDIGAGAEASTDTQAYVEQWKINLGVNVNIRQIDSASFFADLDLNKMQMYGIGWIMDYPDPENILDLKFHSKSAENNENYSNFEVDNLLEKARIETDSLKRVEYYQEAERMIVRDVPWIPTYFAVTHYVVSDKLNNWLEPSMIVPRLRFASLQEK